MGNLKFIKMGQKLIISFILISLLLGLHANPDQKKEPEFNGQKDYLELFHWNRDHVIIDTLRYYKDKIVDHTQKKQALRKEARDKIYKREERKRGEHKYDMKIHID